MFKKLNMLGQYVLWAAETKERPSYVHQAENHMNTSLDIMLLWEKA